LRKSEERHRLLSRQLYSLLQSAEQGIIGLDASGRCTFINRAAAGMLGARPEEAVGRDVHELLHSGEPDGARRFPEECPIHRAVRAGEPVRRDDEVFWRADGSTFPVEYACSPTVDEDGARGAVVTFSDITRRKTTEEALRQSEEKFRLLTEAMPQLVWSGPPEGGCDYANPRWLEYTGLSQAEIQGDNWLKALHPEDHRVVLETGKRAIATGGLFQAEQRLRGKDGRYRWFLGRALLLRDAAGRGVRRPRGPAPRAVTRPRLAIRPC
jgi:PAS domain S-box-containing protein